jgi:cell pole-organizing protein PopZ
MSGFDDISNNSGPGSSAEPSMEEILASIRRILKEDETTRAAPPVDLDEDVLVLDSSMRADAGHLGTGELSTGGVLSPTELPPEESLGTDHPDAPVTSYHNEMHIASEPAPMTADFEAGPTEDLSAMLPGEPEPAAPPQSALAPEGPMPHETGSEPPTQTRQETAPEPTMSEHFQPPDGLIGESAKAAAQHSIGALVRSIGMERAVAVSRGGITIEEIVREEIRPMLKSWLDSHLPVLVERIVRAEIERVVERTQL